MDVIIMYINNKFLKFPFDLEIILTTLKASKIYFAPPKFMGLIYPPWMPRFVGYLSPANSDEFIVCVNVGTLLQWLF